MRLRGIPPALDAIQSFQEHWEGAQGPHDAPLMFVALTEDFQLIVMQLQAVDLAFGFVGCWRKMTTAEAELHNGARR
jgi:hypothetical protein